MSDVDVSIVIPTKNDEATIRECLQSIEGLEYPSKRRETIVVDGHSSDDTVPIAREFDCRVTHETKGTIAHAREVGIAEAEGTYVAFTDADCVVPTDWIDALLAPFDDPQFDGPIAGVGGPNRTPADDTWFARAVGGVLDVLSEPGSRYAHDAHGIHEIYHNPTCNVIYRRKVLLEVGGFNEDLVTVDDEEMDFRIRESGYTLLFTPDAAVEHYRRPDVLSFAGMAYRYGYGRAQAGRLHSDLLSWFHVAPSFGLLATAASLGASVFVPALALVALGLFLCGILGSIGLGFVLGRRRSHLKTPIYATLVAEWLFFWGVGFGHGAFARPVPADQELNASHAG